MPGTGIQRGARRIAASTYRDHQLIARAARRAGLAGAALASAAGDLDNAHSRDGNPLAGLAEMMREEAVRVAHLVADIERHTPRSAAVEP